MSANTKIEWADHTFNPWEGCQKVGPGCDNCYAESRNARFGGGQSINWGPGAPRRRTSAANWHNPVRWNADAKAFQEQHGRRQRVFCASLADVFDSAVDPQWRVDLATLILNTPDIDWLLLTKRIGNAARMLAEMFLDGTPDNVMVGATIVNQPEADRDIPKLLRVPARVRFLSVEPLLQQIKLRWEWVSRGRPLGGGPACNLHEPWKGPEPEPAVDWVIVGGESGPSARPMHPDWVRSLRDQCDAAGVPFLFKQWGEWTEFEPNSPAIQVDPATAQGKALAARCDAFLSVDGHCVDAIGKTVHSIGYRGMSRVGKKQAGRLLDGRTHDGFPS